MPLATPISWAKTVFLACLGLVVAANPAVADPPAAATGFAANAQRSFQAAQEHYRNAPGEAAAGWQFARACFDLAEFATNKTQRAALAEQGIAASRQVITNEPSLAQAYYYLGMNLGQIGRA